MAIFKQKGHKGKKQIGCAWPKFSLSFVNSISCFKTLKMTIFNNNKKGQKWPLMAKIIMLFIWIF